MPKLVVVPTDPLDAYEGKGIGGRLRDYYNPQSFFDEVVCLSPFEWSRGHRFGMRIEPTPDAETFSRWLATEAPDVIRVYGGGRSMEFAAQAQRNQIPLVVSVHDISPAFLGSAVTAADWVIVMSELVARCVEALGVEASRIDLLANRIDTNVFRPPIRQPGQPMLTPTQVLHLGRKSPQKNLDGVLRALALLPEEITLLAVGQGDSLEYETLAKSLGVQSRVRFMGGVPSCELPGLMAASLCLCNPSRWEGFGVVFIEALAVGLPVITSSARPASEICVEGITGLMVGNVEDPGEIAARIAQLHADPILWRRLSRNGVVAAKRYEQQAIDEKEVEIYKKVLNHGKSI